MWIERKPMKIHYFRGNSFQECYFFLCHGSQTNCCCELEGTVQVYASGWKTAPAFLGFL